VERPLFTPNEVRRRFKLRAGSTSGSSWRRAKQVFGNRCAYCRRGGENLQKDHVVPLSRGGMDIPLNVVPACEDCNASKGDQDVRYWMRARGYNFGFFFVRWSQLRRSS
jgi:5-methylcytosine-specific restriction endonuclease McrA